MSDGTEPGIDVKQTPAYRGLMAAVIILGVLIFLALAALIAGFVMKMRGHGPAQLASTAYVPPRGARLVSVEASGDRLVLRLHTQFGDEVDIVDTQDGHLVARLPFSP